ncbi:hypothetical protein BCD49_17920 [Pseudofrankia sp. EUN1h]|nr:hypothetical protein BCD49_17920 [Pseudofrankia sp. EUN1h]
MPFSGMSVGSLWRAEVGQQLLDAAGSAMAAFEPPDPAAAGGVDLEIVDLEIAVTEICTT